METTLSWRGFAQNGTEFINRNLFLTTCSCWPNRTVCKSYNSGADISVVMTCMTMGITTMVQMRSACAMFSRLFTTSL